MAIEHAKNAYALVQEATKTDARATPFLEKYRLHIVSLEKNKTAASAAGSSGSGAPNGMPGGMPFDLNTLNKMLADPNTRQM